MKTWECQVGLQRDWNGFIQSLLHVFLCFSITTKYISIFMKRVLPNEKVENVPLKVPSYLGLAL